MRNKAIIGIFALFVVISGFAGWWFLKIRTLPTETEIRFNSQRAYEDVVFQVNLGPRIPGSLAHEKAIEWMQSELASAGWQSSVQSANMLGHTIKNVIASRDNQPPRVILAAHFDSRIFADKDPDPSNHVKPVPGANDGASGVAVLLEIARILPSNFLPVWLVFLDAEDNGNIPGWDWILGSTAFVSQLKHKPEAVVIVDMVGDSDLQLYMELNSDIQLSTEIWAHAAALGYGSSFIPTPKYAIIDDHIPFIRAGIPAVDIIDIEYEFHHTIQDTPDKVSPLSLKVVGDTLIAWLLSLYEE